MSKISFKKLNLFISLLFFLIYPNQVNASRLDVASQYGFNDQDATSALQTAIDSKAADTLIVRNMGKDWIVTPIFLRSANQTIIFESGVIVTAKKGAFHGNNDCLFSTRTAINVGSNANNISLIGYGATFRMQKAEYMNPALYAFSGDRHGINICYDVSGIRILGLTIKETGGDGVDCIYGSSNILIKDVICDNNYRNAMSVEDNTNLTIENCIMINTGGSPYGPGYGIDFEPWITTQKLTNIKMINCFMEKNVGYGVGFALRLMDNTSPAISAELRHCFISGVLSVDITANGPTGTISLDDCFLGNSPREGFLCNKSADRLPMKFTNCQWQNCGTAAIKFSSTGSGNLQFASCTINETDSQAIILRAGTVANISGDIKVNSLYGALSDFGTGGNVTVQITENKSTAPVVASVTPAKYSVFGWGNTIDVSAEAYDPDKGTANGAGITKVDFALWRGDAAVATISDASAPFEVKFNKTTTYEQGIYLVRITASSQDGSNTVAVVPISLLGTPNSSGLTFTSAAKVTLPNNTTFSYKATLMNTTGTAASFTFLKKPSWVTTTGDSAYGKAPAAPGVDTLIIVATAGAVKETLKVVITVNSFILIEAESGTLAAPMQIKSDASASGGKCITTPAGTGNTISPKDTTKYIVNITQADTYYVWLRVLVPAIPSNNWGTFFGFNGVITKPGITNMNAGRYEWIIGSAAGFSLKAGANQFILGHGNEQVQIDQIIISSSPIAQLPPTSIDKPNLRGSSNIGKSGLEKNVLGNTINFLVNLEQGGNFTLRTYNVSGQKIWEKNLEKCSAGLNRITLDKKFIKNGVYMTEFSNKNVHSVIKYAVVE
jgi:hypothetical protein